VRDRELQKAIIRRRRVAALVAAVAVGVVVGLVLVASRGGGGAPRVVPAVDAPALVTSLPLRSAGDGLPGTPAPLDPHDVYAADRPGQLSPAVRFDRPLVYVPNSESATVSEIDPASRTVVATLPVGRLPQHVVPSWDLRTLWVANDAGNSLTALNPRTGRPGRTVPVTDPYNLYFTPNGRFAIVVSEALSRLDFRDPQSMALRHTLALPCSGADHLDFTASGRYALLSCEFSGELLVIDVLRQRVAYQIGLPAGSMPQDVKLSPDGATFFVADQTQGGLFEFYAKGFRRRGFLATGAGAHGLYVDRASRALFVSNRRAGTVSVVSFQQRRVVRTFQIPGGSPDMGGLSADGRELWLSGRYNAEVYDIDVRTGRLLARIPVGQGPHGLCVFPQPGRYSLGHTGILR